MGGSLTFNGSSALYRTLREMSDDLKGPVLVGALKDAAEPMRRTMASLAPREPGAPDIADNIVVSPITRLGSVKGGEWEQKTDTEEAVGIGPSKSFFYGLFLEYGTVKMGARPFMRPAFDQGVTRAVTDLAIAMWRRLDQAVAKRRGSAPSASGTGHL